MKKIEKVFLAIVILLTVNVTLSLAQDSNKNPFIGKWEVTTLDTPEGDIKIELEFMVKEGKLVGTIAKKDVGKTELSKVEWDGEIIEFGFYSSSLDIELLYYLEIVEKGVSEGYLLDMFELKGKKVKAKE